MTLGQMMEILVTLVMPFCLVRLGIKKIMLTAMAAWTLRYVFFAFGNSQDSLWMLYLGILLQGICFAFVFVAGQIFVDRQARPEIRAAAQGLITFVTFGVGMLVGSWLSGVVAQAYTHGELSALTRNWPAIWTVPALISAGVFVLFALFFKPSRETDYGSPQ
jgi:MFS family permease